jgi:hypothetical protein
LGEQRIDYHCNRFHLRDN